MAQKFPSMCEAYCKSCGYDLQGSVEAICPECGQAFDPYDVGTFTLKQYRDEPLFGKTRGRVETLSILYIFEVVAIVYPMILMGAGKISYVLNAAYYGVWPTPYEYVADSFLVIIPAAIALFLAIFAPLAIIIAAVVLICSALVRFLRWPIRIRSSLATIFIFLAWALLIVDIYFCRLLWIDTLWILD